ncbi:hypothetical protein FLONG3_4491 [Fusarium longipes]|uniref:Uncharacterized protein n=1 Tax=Fusarium longipes TaxID=694270 RepID=A0A395SZ44_9HYPO|nr:hypothetical protein FLONG3_4491 [Fusarium longipes]
MRPLPQPSYMPPAYLGKVPSIITSIRQLPTGVAPTLESIPQFNYVKSYGEPLSTLIKDMQATDFRRWGFVVFRTVYTEESQPLWESYIEFLKASVEDSLEFKELSTLLKPLLEWTIIEDRETLDNASKQKVRERFSEWASQCSIERDGPGAEEALRQEFPRFRYCIYIDQKCLDTVAQYEAWAEAGAQGVGPEVVCVLLDKKWNPRGQGRGSYPRIEGCRKSYTGWQYTGVGSLAHIYDKLSKQNLAGYDYKRPPGMFPGNELMPLD